MLYSQIKRETLEHIRQYTVSGHPVAPAYNCQEDYLLMIPNLINEALVNILTTVKPAPEVYVLSNGEVYGNTVRYKLPEDFWSLKTGGITVIDGQGFHSTNEYWLQGKDYILIPKSVEGDISVEYYRYPHRLPAKPEDDFDLDEDIEVIQTATYYAAANMSLYDDASIYAMLYNDYESRLSRMSRGIAMEVHAVEDVYGFGAGVV